MTSDDPAALGGVSDPLVVVLVIVASTLIVALLLGWLFAYRRRLTGQAWWAATSLGMSLIIFATVVPDLALGR